MVSPDDLDARVLAFEQAHPQIGPAKNEAIRSQLGLTPVRYYQLVARLAESAEALQSDPVLVHRLRRLREQHARERDDRAVPPH